MSSATTRIPQFAWSILRPGRFGRQVATLAGGAAVSQAIILASAPLLTRLYSPEAFGIVGAFISLHLILLVTMCGGYEFATPIAEDDQTAANLTVLCGMIALAMGALFSLALWLASDWIIAFSGNADLKTYIWLLPPGLLAGALFNAFQSWSLREKKYSRISQARIAQSTTRVLTQGILGLAWASPLGLIFGEVVALLAGTGLLGRQIFRRSTQFFQHVSLATVGNVAKRYARFPLYTMPGSLIGGLATGLPCILLPMLFGTAEAGLFFVARRLAFAPTTLIGSAVGNVFFVELAEGKHDKQKSTRQFLRLSGVLFAIALASASVLCTAPSWAALVFGAEWDEAGWILVAMTPMLVGWFVVTPLSRVFYVFEKQHLLTALELVRFVLTAVVLLAAAAAGFSVVIVVLLLSLTMLLLYCVNWAVMFSILKRVHQGDLPNQQT